MQTPCVPLAASDRIYTHNELFMAYSSQATGDTKIRTYGFSFRIRRWNEHVQSRSGVTTRPFYPLIRKKWRCSTPIGGSETYSRVQLRLPNAG